MDKKKNGQTASSGQHLPNWGAVEAEGGQKGCPSYRAGRFHPISLLGMDLLHRVILVC